MAISVSKKYASAMWYVYKSGSVNVEKIISALLAILRRTNKIFFLPHILNAVKIIELKEENRNMLFVKGRNEPDNEVLDKIKNVLNAPSDTKSEYQKSDLAGIQAKFNDKILDLNVKKILDNWKKELSKI